MYFDDTLRVTQPPVAQAALRFDSNQGFATANPLGGPVDLGFTGDFVDAGPNDHGALFDFGFGALDAGTSTTFNIFYGGAASEAAAETAINAVGAEVFSMGEPSTEDGPTLGTPNTFIFAFGSVGGDPIFSPIAVDDTLITTIGVPGSVYVLGNDSDPDDDPLTVTTLTPTAAHGTVACTAAGLCTYTPAAGYSGPDSFDYDISDGNGGSDTGTVLVTVASGNQPPVGTPDAYSTPRDTVLTVPALTGVLSNDTDADGDTLTATKVADPTHGVVTVAADGSFVYTPTAGYVGPDAFTYNVGDGTATVGPVTVSLTVTKVNRAPTLQAMTDRTTPELALFNLTALGSDPDGDALTYSLPVGPSGLTINVTSGVLSWTPTEAQGPGTYDVTVRVGDTAIPALVAEVSFKITVSEVNLPPVVDPIADTSLVVGVPLGVDANATDPDVPANALVFSLPTAPAGASINASTGAVSWTPLVADVGPHAFTVRATDNGSPGLSDDEDFVVTVTPPRTPPRRSTPGAT